jgi:hypothetical protein
MKIILKHHTRSKNVRIIKTFAFYNWRDFSKFIKDNVKYGKRVNFRVEFIS